MEPGRRFGPVRLRRDRRVLHRQRGNRQKTSTSRMTVRFGLSTWSLPSTLLISTAGSSSAGSPHAPGSSMVRRPRAYPVIEIADTQPVPFPDFDRHVLDRAQLQAVMRARRYAAWRTPLCRRWPGSASSLTLATVANTWARPMEPRTFVSAGAPAWPTGTAQDPPHEQPVGCLRSCSVFVMDSRR